MKLQHLRFLVAVVDYGGVIKAAERLHISQPSVSAGLKALEQDLGAPLFDRDGAPNRPLRLTPAGRRFYQEAVDILQRCESARQAFSGTATALPRLRLGVLETLSAERVTQAYRHYTQHHPTTRLDLWQAGPDRLAGWLASGRVDVAWTDVDDLTPHARVLWREALVAVLAPDHPLARTGIPLSLADLARQPFIHRSRCELDAVGRAQLKAAGIKLNVRVRAEQDDLAFHLVRAGQGITLAPRSLVPADLTTAPVSGFAPQRSIGLRWREELDPKRLADLVEAIGEAWGEGN